MHLLTRVDEVLEQCEVSRAFDNAPRSPAAGTSAVAMFSEAPHVHLQFLGDIIAVHAMDVLSKDSLLIPVRTKNPV